MWKLWTILLVLYFLKRIMTAMNRPYYLSRTLVGAESRYNPIEKECLTLVFAIQKARHYLVGQTIHVISRVNPLRLLMMKSGSLNSRLAKWATYFVSVWHALCSSEGIKGQSFAYFLPAHPIPESSNFMKIFQMRFSNPIWFKRRSVANILW